MVSWSTIQTLLLFLAPYLVPKIIAFLRSIFTPSQPGGNHTNLTKSSRGSIFLLLLFSSITLLTLTPLFPQPRNIFSLTSSRLQTPNNVLFKRLSTIHSSSNSTPSPNDDQIRHLFEKKGLEARLLYFKFGHEVLNSCLYIDSNNTTLSNTQLYLFHSAIHKTLPHLIHVLILALCTSTIMTIGTKQDNERDEFDAVKRWRKTAIILGFGLFIAEMGILTIQDHLVNSAATKYEDILLLYWTLRKYRIVTMASMDLLLALAIWLTATGRAFGRVKTKGEKMNEIIERQEYMLFKLRGLGMVKNVLYRNEELRKVVGQFCVENEMKRQALLEDENVVTAINTVKSKMDMKKVDVETDMHINALLPKSDVNNINVTLSS